MRNPEFGARLLRAAIGLGGPVEPGEDDFGYWARIAQEGRVFPLLHRVVHSEASGLAELQRDRASDYQRDAMVLAVRIEHELLEVANTLEQNGVGFAVLKGVATAHLDYQCPSLRQFGDVDLIVDPSAFETSIAALGQAGWNQAYPLPRHHEQTTHAITLRSGSGIEVDLHRKVAHRAIGELISTRELLRATVDYQIAGHPLLALSANDRLIHAAIHVIGSRGKYRRLSSFADVLVMAERLALSSDAVLSRAAKWRVQSLVEAGIRASYDAALLPTPDAWLRSLDTPQPRKSWLLDRAYLSDTRRPVIEEVAFLKHLHGGRNRLRYVFGYFTTDDGYAVRNRRKGLRAQSRYLWAKLFST